MNTNPPLRDALASSRQSDGLAGYGLESRDRGFELRAFLNTFRRGKWAILFVLLLGLAFAKYQLSLAVPLYTAEATVRLDRSENQIADLQGVVSGLSAEYETLNTEALVLTTHHLLGRVVDELDLINDPEFVPPEETEPGVLSSAFAYVRDGLSSVRDLVIRSEEEELDLTGGRWDALVRRGAETSPEREQAIAALAGAVSVAIIDFSYAISISVMTEDPAKSAVIANTLADLYVENQLESKFEATRRATVWLNDQVAELKVDLEDAEAAVEDFASAAPNLSEEGLQELAQRLDSLRQRRTDRAGQQEALTRRLADARLLLETRDFQEAAVQLEDPAITRLARQLTAAASEADRSRLAAEFDARFAAREKLMENEIAALDRQASALDAAIAEATERLDARGGDMIELRQLEREAEATRLLYEHFLARMKETSVQQGVQEADSEVLERASPPDGPSYPHPFSTMARATVLSLLLGGGLVYMLEHLNRRFRTPEEIEQATGVPVVAVIPTARRGSPVTYVAERPASVLAEAVRNLRTSVLLSPGRAPQVIAVTSSVPGEGKSTTLLMLAQVTAQMGKKTLVIEGDIRRPNFKGLLEQTDGRGFLSSLKLGSRRPGKDPGLLSVLSGETTIEEAVKQDPRTGLDVIFSEATEMNAADLFSSDDFGEFVARMREKYDFVFIDTPPVLLVPDARILAQSADALVYAVRWNSTTRDQVTSGLKMLAQSRINVAGLAMTRVETRAMGSYGYQGYGYTYGYGGYYRN